MSIPHPTLVHSSLRWFLFCWVFCLFFVFAFSRQGFSVDLESVLELALVDQTGLKLTEILLPLPPECRN